MSRYFESLLAECFGLPADSPTMKAAVATLYRVGVVDPETVERLERRRRIYELHTDPRCPVPVAELATRFGCDRSTIHRAIAEELRSRRAS